MWWGRAVRRVALVDCGPSGIGSDTAMRLARDGFDLSVRRTADDVDGLAAVRAVGRRVLTTGVDLGDPDDVRQWISRTEELLGPVSAAVTIAMAATVDSDSTGLHNIFRAVVVRMMKRQEGVVVAICSPAQSCDSVGHDNCVAGTIAFCRALAADVRRYGVRVNVLVPGRCRPDEVAERVGHLISGRARHVTGAVLRMN
ncbi:SDR family NAD(P)-dependent oxidoreductase [Kutzneria buriramensis]|uniref:3-oxoacyl-[acyl-carrier protein] reductase n=1 Tax=Kutzneria buriramensis TaxID=1045776 RepID=A0A3E0GVB3_9PSEU|nr:SDR family NAD(P)-dependent oxidoreductase [Kutzneria buriramensis]REH26975.1 3-oxoacyl-[acyl-carrier protein] reductase [Kutzneria buriramensis]